MAVLLYGPRQAKQLADDPSFSLGSVSCTCYEGEVCTDRNTFGKTIISGKKIRVATGDKVGGTSVQQVDDAIQTLTGDDNLSTGYWNFDHVDQLIATEGKGFLIAIRYREVLRFHQRQLRQKIKQADLVGGIEQGFGESADDWHAETWHEWIEAGGTRTIRGKVLKAPSNQRGMVVYDPLCDGRRPTVAIGPVVYPERLVKKIVADSFLSGSRVYGAVTLDARFEVDDPPPVMPNRTLKYGGKPIAKKALKAVRPGWKRSSPRISRANPRANQVRHLGRGDLFRAFQTAEGTKVGKNGSRLWYGNRGGDVWVHSSRFAK
jgi:hypothetical protein